MVSNSQNKPNILFMGSGDFAIPVLEVLLQNPLINLVGVVTQPDKPGGRGHNLTPSAVKRFVAGYNTRSDSRDLRIFTPDKLRQHSAEILEESQPDLIVVAAYGQMIPDDMLTLPRLGAINIHASILPELRGAVPIQAAILQGKEVTGVTIQKVVKEMDEGDIFALAELPIKEDDNAGTLMVKLSALGAGLLVELLPSLLNGSAKSTPQDHLRATYCYQRDITREKAEIKYDTSVDGALRMIRAFNPWPVAWITINLGGESKMLKIFKAIRAEASEGIELERKGAMQLGRSGKGLYLELTDGFLQLLEVQLESKKKDGAVNYLYLAEH